MSRPNKPRHKKNRKMSPEQKLRRKQIAQEKAEAEAQSTSLLGKVASGKDVKSKSTSYPTIDIRNRNLVQGGSNVMGKVLLSLLAIGLGSIAAISHMAQ